MVLACPKARAGLHLGDRRSWEITILRAGPAKGYGYGTF